MAKHALLSPSSASRWLACTPSPRLEAQYPDQTSEFAEEGALAHSMAEIYLRYHDDPKGLAKALKDISSKDPLYQKYYNSDLDQHAHDFANYVLELCSGDYKLEIEQRLDFTEWVEQGFGTGDAIVVKDEVLNLIDLKYGKGVRVSAIENTQLKIYALGCWAKYSWMYDFDTVRLHIYQPRLDNISIWSISVEDLLLWAEEELVPKAALAYEGKGEQVPGEHCRFCKAKAECRALANHALELAKEEFAEPKTLSPEEIGAIIPKIDIAEIYIKAVREHAYSKLLSGESIPGYKLVKGRATRTYTNIEAIKKALLEAGFGEDDILTPIKQRELLGVTALEKNIKKKNFDTIVDPYITRVEGKPSMAPETDKREEYSSVQSDFGSELTGGEDWMG